MRVWRVVAVLLCCVNSAVAQEAPVDPAKTELRTLWRFQQDGMAFDTLATQGGVVFLAAEKGALIALNADDGTRVWEQDFGVVASTVLAFTDDLVIVMLVSSESSLVALDLKTGDFRWLRSIPYGITGPVVVGDVICGASSDGHAYAIKIKDGGIVWRTEYLADAPADPPGFDGKRARDSEWPARPRYAVSDGNSVYFSVFDQCRALRFDIQTGKRLASYPTRGWMYMKPVVTDKHVFAGSQDQFLYCFDKQTGVVVWKHETKSRVEAPACLDGDRVYWGSCDANLYCLNRETGEVVWTFGTDKYPAKYGGPIYEAAVVAGDTVLLPAMEGQVYAIDARSGKLITKHRPSPVSQIDDSAWDGRRLFVTTRKNFENEGEEAVYAIGR